MLPHEYLDGLYLLRRQEQANISESIGRVARKESALTANRVVDHIRQLREESWPLLEAIDSEIERMTGYCSSWHYKFWVACHEFLWLIWLATISVSLCFFFRGPIDAREHGGNLPGYTIFIGIMAAFSFVWAIWSSIIPDYHPKA